MITPVPERIDNAQTVRAYALALSVKLYADLEQPSEGAGVYRPIPGDGAIVATAINFERYITSGLFPK